MYTSTLSISMYSRASTPPRAIMRSASAAHSAAGHFHRLKKRASNSATGTSSASTSSFSPSVPSLLTLPGPDRVLLPPSAKEPWRRSVDTTGDRAPDTCDALASPRSNRSSRFSAMLRTRDEAASASSLLAARDVARCRRALRPRRPTPGTPHRGGEPPSPSSLLNRYVDAVAAVAYSSGTSWSMESVRTTRGREPAEDCR
mmetsp:Transcript_16802/g.52534  ORF Transcript_16802/g.52534 Transcript_16802/m.52534 type:complete len:201 (+) Transcript_16802:1671-2273(+)